MHSLKIERSVEVVIRLSSDSMNVVIAGRDEKTRIFSLGFVCGRSPIQFTEFAFNLQCFVCWCVR